jgi:hypothetical protein
MECHLRSQPSKMRSCLNNQHKSVTNIVQVNRYNKPKDGRYKNNVTEIKLVPQPPDDTFERGPGETE